jgi:hypothetical protein
MVAVKPYGKCSRATSQDCLVHLVFLVYLVYLVQLNEPDRPNRRDRPVRFFSVLLISHPSGELRKELPCEVVGVVLVEGILAAKIVVEDSAVCGLVDVRQADIHMVAFDGAGYATDEDYGTIRFLPLDDPNMRQWVVHLAISIVVPCIVEEDEIAWVGDWSLVERTLLPDMCMDDPDAVGVRVN